MGTNVKTMAKTTLLVVIVCSVLLSTSHGNFYGKRNGGYGKSLKDLLQDIQLREPAGETPVMSANVVLQQIGELIRQWSEAGGTLNHARDDKRGRI